MGAQRGRARQGWNYFLQAEDGILDLTVTGVQTCSLPIWKFVFSQSTISLRVSSGAVGPTTNTSTFSIEVRACLAAVLSTTEMTWWPQRRNSSARAFRSEESRVGKEWRSRW